MTLDTNKVETCLRIYIEYKKSANQDQLLDELRLAGIEPREFEYMIDRIIQLKTSTSAKKHAQELLEVFQNHRLSIASVLQSDVQLPPSGLLDLEIMSVFNDSPELLREAF